MLYVIGFELLDREYRESNATYLTFPGVLSRTRDTFLEAMLSTPVRPPLFPPFAFRTSLARHDLIGGPHWHATT